MNTTSYIKQVLTRSALFSSIILACKELLSTYEAGQINDYLDSRITQVAKKKFEFGYFPDENNLSLLIDKIGFSTLKGLGLIYSDGTGFFSKHNVIMPIKDDYGHIVALVGRTLLSEEEQKNQDIQKYKYTSGYKKANNLFGLYHAKNAIRKSKKVILVEGQIDCITCHSNFLPNTVALGGSSMSDYQMFLLMKYGPNLKINLLLDNDDAGKKAEQKIIEKYSEYIDISCVSLPNEYKDVDLFLRKSPDHSLLSQLY